MLNLEIKWIVVAFIPLIIAILRIKIVLRVSGGILGSKRLVFLRFQEYFENQCPLY